MELASVDAHGRTTIPNVCGWAARAGSGDTLAFEVHAEQLVVRKVPVVRNADPHR